MKNLQHFTEKEPESSDISPDKARLENPSESGRTLKQSSQTLAGLHEMENQTVADRIRNYCLHILIFVLTCHAVFGEIKNGYEKNILATKESLSVLRATLLDDQKITPAQRRKLQATIAILVNHLSYYDLTESLLLQFKSIAPELYADIDTIKDRIGRPVNVYIKFVPVDGTNVKAEGTTYLGQSDYDKDAYQSEYGEFTVSVKVWIVPKALLVLAHELGHVKYQVPNLASYFVFHKKHYYNTSTPNFIGHDIDDPSGKSAVRFAKSYQRSYTDFLKISIVKVQNPLAVLAKLKKNWSKNTSVL